MVSPFVRHQLNRIDDRIRQREQTLRATANRLRGLAAAHRQFGDDASAHELDTHASVLKDLAALLLQDRRDMLTIPGDDDLDDTLVDGEIE